MGFLRNIRNGPFGGGAIVFWGIAGSGLGVGSATLVHLQDEAMAVAIASGGMLGICVGVYAAQGTTKFARGLAPSRRAAGVDTEMKARTT